MEKSIKIFVILIAFIFVGSPIVSQAQQTATSDISNVDEAVEYIRSMHYNRDFEIGEKEGERLINIFPESVELRAWHIANMARSDKAEEAVNKAEKLVEKYPDNSWSHFALVRSLTFHEESEKDASEIADNVLAMKPDHPDFLWMKSSVISENEQEIAFIDSVMDRVNNPANLLTKKGHSLINLSQDTSGEKKEQLFQEALSAFEQARNLDTSCFDAWYLPAYYLNQQGDKQKAFSLYQKAIDLTTALRAHSEYWRMVMGMDDLSSEEKQETILADIESLSERRPQTPEMLFNFVNQYGELEMEEEKKRLEQRILEEYSDDVYAEWVLVNRYRNFSQEHSEQIHEERDPEIIAQYRNMLWDFLNRPTHNRETLIGDAYRNLFYTYREDSTANADTLLRVVNGMVKYEGINVHITHGEGSKLLAERNIDYARAEEIARQGIEEAREKINEQREWAYDTEEEYQNAMDSYTGRMYDALGWVFFQEGQIDSAQKYLSKGYSLNNENRENLYHMGQLHEKKENNLQAEEYYIKGMAVTGSGENPNTPALKSLYVKMHGSTEGYDEYLASLEQKNEAQRKEDILSSRKENSEPIQPFELNTLQGEPFSSEQLDGKISVINHWGLWCGPCVEEMPDIQKLHEKYSDNPDVQILTINNDPSIEEVREWMEENEYDFPVLRDDGYLNKAGVNLFPTTWFLNPKSEIAFVKESYTEELVEEFSWRVEALEED